MTLRAVDVHGFGGGFTLGTVQAGFELAAKFSRDKGFGVFNTLGNRHLLGNKWESVADEPSKWEPVDCDFVFGNPPCSGFSTLSNKDFRGMDSSINEYMWELIRYAGKVAPPVVAWESVQGTFRQGLPLMRELHDTLEKMTGKQYTLYHVLHNNLSHGGVSMRKRYFWVASQVPFGVDTGRVTRHGEFADLDHVPTFRDMLTDLAPLGMTMHSQPYRNIQPFHGFNDGWEIDGVRVMNSSRWAQREVHDFSGMVDGHDVYHSKTLSRTVELLRYPEIDWKEGERMGDAMRKFYEMYGHLPKSWDYLTKKLDPDTGEVVHLTKAQRIVETDFFMGVNQPARWRANRPANVITGGAVHLVVHPWLQRLITHREAARIQGFPDDWSIYAVKDAPDLGPGWGKGVPVQAGRWIARWVRSSLEGEPGPITGVPLGESKVPTHKAAFKEFGGRDREFIIDTTYDYRRLVPEDADFR